MVGRRTRETEEKLLRELLKNSKKSDRELARVLKVSQPTISRMRVKLEKNKLIQEYTIVPDLVKLGYEILAINTYSTPESPGIEKKASEMTNSWPCVLFAARVDGMGKNGIMISLHKNYEDCANFARAVKMVGEGIITQTETMLISLKGFIPKPFSLKHLAKALETEEDKET